MAHFVFVHGASGRFVKIDADACSPREAKNALLLAAGLPLTPFASTDLDPLLEQDAQLTRRRRESQRLLMRERRAAGLA